MAKKQTLEQKATALLKDFKALNRSYGLETRLVLVFPKTTLFTRFVVKLLHLAKGNIDIEFKEVK